MGDECIIGGIAGFVCCLVLCSCLIGASGIIMLSVGASCLGNDSYDLCGSKGGAIALVICGCILFCICCCSVSIGGKKKMETS